MGAGWGFQPGCRPEGDDSIRDPRNEDVVGSAPTTGGPVDLSWCPEGCRCYIREDVEYGDVITRPPGGCPVHPLQTLAELDGPTRETVEQLMAGLAQQLGVDWPLLAASAPEAEPDPVPGKTVEELMAEVAQQVTEDVLWPGLAALGIEDPTRYRLAIDTTPLLMEREAGEHHADPSTAVPAGD